MEAIISALIGAISAVMACIINNNTMRAKTQHEIEMKVAEINATNEKSTLLLSERITNLTDHVNKHNNLVERMYNVESITIRLGDMQKSLDERVDRLEGR